MTVLIQDQNGLLTRIEHSRRALLAMRLEVGHEQDRRDGLIRQAIDDGTPYRAVGHAAGMTAGGVAKVMSKPPAVRAG